MRISLIFETIINVLEKDNNIHLEDLSKLNYTLQEKESKISSLTLESQSIMNNLQDTNQRLVTLNQLYQEQYHSTEVIRSQNQELYVELHNANIYIATLNKTINEVNISKVKINSSHFNYFN